MRYPRVRTTLSRLLYRFRPDKPAVGSELLQVRNDPIMYSFKSGGTLRIISWNTHKGTKREYKQQLRGCVPPADLVLLQEFRQSQAYDLFHQEIFDKKHALLAISYYTMQKQSSPTGVCSISKVASMKSIGVTSTSLEPIMRTPKMALCTWYPLNNSDDLLSSLLVLNCHGINFRLRKSFRSQVEQLRDQLMLHTGPIIFVGDFNAWEAGREKILDLVSSELKLTRIHFPKGIKHLGGHQLDRVYVRGGSVSSPEVIPNSRASDHALIKFDFTLD